jgi:hypothetical protein
VKSIKKYHKKLCLLYWLLRELMELVMPNKSNKIKYHFNNVSKITYYDDIKKHLIEGIREIIINCSNIELLFTQVKPEEFK